ncbi:serine-rich adhesin for platelets isoform X2 [Sabethes cyaneus]|uniref:serine-rich adhesin for platelets isoform X2 n=1 Tax=Sabethes cyaneus TaxID=53552 RepID=UPI00237DF34E|nr:serine-rich adhesin for platelets isoform X2 [Sabethes cyaneus]
MDIIDVFDALEDDSFIGDMERLDDEVVEIFKQWKSCGTLPSSSGTMPAAVPSTSRFGFGSVSHHSSTSGANNSSNISISSRNSTLTSDSKGAKYIDTRTFTRPKKKLDTTFNSSNISAEFRSGVQEEHKVPSPLLNVHIGGPVTPSSSSKMVNSSHLMQKSWLNDVSPPGSIMSSMDFSGNEKMGGSLITSGDFTNVSCLLNTVTNSTISTNEEMLNSQSSFDGYKLADVIKDRKFLESLSCLDDSTLTKDSAISRTDLNGIEGTLSGLSTMQNSLESVSKSADSRLSDVTTVANGAIAELASTSEELPEAGTRGKINTTFERRRNFDTYRKPKSFLNGTFDTLPKVDDDVEHKTVNRTFDAVQHDGQLLDATYGMENNCNGTFSLNRTAKVDGAEKQLNQTYEYCEKNSPTIPALNRTFERPTNETLTEPTSPKSPEINNSHIQTPNGTFELPADGKTAGDTTTIVQSTPFVNVPRTNRVSDISQYDVNVSPISPHVVRRSEVVRRSRNLNDEMSASHLETDDFDVEFRKLPNTPNCNKTDSSNGSHLLESEKRISLQHFEEFEKSIMESEHNGLDFDEMLNSLTDVKRSMDSVKLRQSLDNIKKRHSRMNSEKQLEDLRKRTEMNDSLSSPLDNKLVDSMAKSMSSSSGSERLLNRRSRYNDDVNLTLSPSQKTTDISVQDSELQSTNETKTVNDPPPTEQEVGGSDSKKNRDRFKTIRINKRLAEGMVVVPSPEETIEDCCQLESVSLPVEEEILETPVATEPSAFSRVDYNSPKESRLSTTITTNPTTVSSNMDQQSKTEDTMFKRPQGIVKPESKLRSLSKPRLYGGPGGAFGIARKDLSLPLATKSSSTDNLENDRPNYQHSLGSNHSRLSLGGKGSYGVGLVGNGGKGGTGNSVPQSNLKSPMGTKSKSYHNLYYNQSVHGGSNGSVNRIPTPLGLSAQKTSHNNSNTELSGVQMRAPKGNASRLGLVRPSSGYFSYGSHRKNIDSDSESINSLSSSSASSRGSLYRVDSQSIANNVQSYATNNSIEDISGSTGIHSGKSLGPPKTGSAIEPNRTTVGGSTTKLTTNGTINKASGLRPPSNLRLPTARSALPRPTSYVRR